MRKIPFVMASQHPDNASKPYWHTEAYISDQHEVEECFLSFSKLGISEYKWDWEGKFVDESVFERLISEYPSFFKKNPLGKEKFLTFRLPDYRVETEFRMGRALMGIISAAGLAKHVGLHTPPMFEVILPMTETEKEIIAIKEAFLELASLKHPLHCVKNGGIKNIEVIPLFEGVDSIINSSKILERYIKLHKKKFNTPLSYIRPYLARSDSALSSGIVSSVLAIKLALSNYKKFTKITDVELYPILGAGSLPFRGGFTPYNVHQFTSEYKGIKTVLAQSAFQYDFPLDDVKKAIKDIENILKQSVSKEINFKEEREIKKAINLFEPFYRKTIKEIGSQIYSVAIFLPLRRERLKHTGFLKYPRTIEGVKIPRAIGLTAALYSLGVPPELIGTGRGIKKAKECGDLETVERFYLNFKSDLERAGRYLNKSVLKKLAKESLAWEKIIEDVEEIEKYLGHEFEPVTIEEKVHKIMTHEIYEKFKYGISITDIIEEAAILRKSLG